MPEEGSILGASTDTPTTAADTPPQAILDGGQAPPPAEGGKPAEGSQQAGDQKPDGPKPDEPKVPEQYEFKVPDGMTLDPTAVEAFTPVAKELGLSQDQAQKIVDLYATQVAASQKALADGWIKTQQDWAKDLSSDKEFGGEAFNATRNQANTVLAKYATKDEIQQIQAMGLGNFPPFVKLLARAGKAMGEDTFVRGNLSGGAASPEERAKNMYPSMTK